jgi:hypothetical protein
LASTNPRNRSLSSKTLTFKTSPPDMKNSQNT